MAKTYVLMSPNFSYNNLVIVNARDEDHLTEILVTWYGQKSIEIIKSTKYIELETSEGIVMEERIK